MSIKQSRLEGGKLGGQHQVKGKEHGKSFWTFKWRKKSGGVYQGKMASMEKRKFKPKDQDFGPLMI